MHPVFWFAILPVAIAGWWCFLLWTVSHICGWKALVRQYRAVVPFHGTKHRFRTARIGGGKYNGCLTVGADSTGLWLAGMGPFRFSHPPVFIPWTDIAPKMTHHWLLGQWLELALAKVPNVKVRFPKPVAEELAAEANLAWESS